METDELARIIDEEFKTGKLRLAGDPEEPYWANLVEAGRVARQYETDIRKKDRDYVPTVDEFKHYYLLFKRALELVESQQNSPNS